MLICLIISDSNIDFESMPCYSPLVAKRVFDERTQSYKIVFDKTSQAKGQVVYLPCGQCIGCRIARSREWAARLVHENTLWPASCFITLTYSPENLPENGTLVKKHFQDFMKRLRKRFKGVECVTIIDEETGELKDTYPIRFFHCGEYGSQLQRPHYHAILFNFDFPDKEPWKRTRSGELIYRSKALEELWTYGFSSVGSVSFESCAYVARYVTKKITGKGAEKYYQGREPEYVTMSRNPGIARDWFEKYHSDVFPQDFVVLKNGKKISTPRYYMKLLERFYPEVYDIVEQRRLERSQALDRPDFIKDPDDPRKFFNDLDRLSEELAQKSRQGKAVSHRIKKYLPRNLEDS